MSAVIPLYPTTCLLGGHRDVIDFREMGWIPDKSLAQLTRGYVELRNVLYAAVKKETCICFARNQSRPFCMLSYQGLWFFVVHLSTNVPHLLLCEMYLHMWGHSYDQDVMSNEDRVSGKDEGVKPRNSVMRGLFAVVGKKVRVLCVNRWCGHRFSGVACRTGMNFSSISVCSGKGQSSALHVLSGFVAT
jgi:hypothetical protein